MIGTPLAGITCGSKSLTLASLSGFQLGHSAVDGNPDMRDHDEAFWQPQF